MTHPAVQAFREVVDAHARQGSPLASALRPGLPQQEVVQVLRASLDDPGPMVDDLVALWAWHDGSGWVDGTGEVDVLPYYYFIPLAEARRIQQEQIEQIEFDIETGGDGYFEWWDSSWWPVLSGGLDFIVVDAADGVVWKASVAMSSRIRLASDLETFLGWVTWATKERFFYWDEGGPDRRSVLRFSIDDAEAAPWLAEVASRNADSGG